MLYGKWMVKAGGGCYGRSLWIGVIFWAEWGSVNGGDNVIVVGNSKMRGLRRNDHKIARGNALSVYEEVLIVAENR